MNREDYERQLHELQAPPGLRERVAALEEMRPVGRRRRAVRRLAAAACLALAVGAAAWLLPKAPAAISSVIAALRPPDPVVVPTPTPFVPPTEDEAPSAFEIYQGPVLPLTAAGNTSHSAQRELIIDFTDVCELYSNRIGSGSLPVYPKVTDRYTITPSDGGTGLFLYPFAGSMAHTTTYDAPVIPGADYDIPYSPGPAALLPGGLSHTPTVLSAWDEYQYLFDNGYGPNLDVYTLGEAAVTVYDVVDIQGNDGGWSTTLAADIRLSDPDAQIFTYGFNGHACLSPQDGRHQLRFSLNDNAPAHQMIAVVGGTIEEWSFKGYRDGSLSVQLPDLTASLSQGQVSEFQEFLSACVHSSFYPQENQPLLIENALYSATADLILRAACTQTLADDCNSAVGVTSFRANVDDALVGSGNYCRMETLIDHARDSDRIFYARDLITYAAGEPFTLEASYYHSPSFNNYDADDPAPGERALFGFDLAATLGSNLNFTDLTVTVILPPNLTLADQNMGLIPDENGRATVHLDTDTERYYFILTSSKAPEPTAAPVESLYVNEDYGFTLRLPANWEGLYTVDWHVSPAGALCLDFYHLPSYQYTSEDGGHCGLLFSIAMEDAQEGAHSNGGTLGTRNGIDFTLYVPTDITWVPETAQSYKELDDSLNAVGIENCFELDMDFYGAIPFPTTVGDVLRGQRPFLYGRDRLPVDLADYPALVDPYDDFMELRNFTIVDLDGDGAEEAILHAMGVAGDMGRYLVLRQEGPYVQSYEADYRMFESVKTDGSFTYTDWAGTKEAIASVSFRDREMAVEDHAAATGERYIMTSFTVDGKKATQAEYDAAMAAQAKKPDTKWYDFTDANVRALFPVSAPEGIIGEEVYVSDDLLAAAVEWVKGEYALYAENAGGMYRHPNAVYDNWRIDDIKSCGPYRDLIPNESIDVYHVSWRIHTTTPELGGNLAGTITEDMEDGWFTPHGCDYLVFRYSSLDNGSTLLFHLAENDCQPGSDTFKADLERALLERIPVTHPEGSVAEDIDVPDTVLYSAKEYIKEQYYLAHLPQTYGVGVTEDTAPDFDDWQIKSLEKCYESDEILKFGTVMVYEMDWGLHTTTPELTEHLPGSQHTDEDGWFALDATGIYLVFIRFSDYDGKYFEFTGGFGTLDTTPGDVYFDAGVKQTLADYFSANPPLASGFATYGRLLNIEGLRIDSPLDGIPQNILDTLTPTGEVEHLLETSPEMVCPYAIQTYTAPGLTVRTVKLDVEWMEQEVKAGDRTQESLDDWVRDAKKTNGGVDREFIWSVSVTDSAYATGGGLRVGMTTEEASALFYPLADGNNHYQYAILYYFNATVENGIVTLISVSSGGRYLGNIFW